MQILDPIQTAQALPYQRLAPAIESVSLQLSKGEIHAPERQVVTIDASSVLLSMPAIASDIGVTKLITVHGNNAQHRLPAIQGEVIVFDTATGRRLALLDGPTVTARRTAAVTLTGICKLAPAKPASAVLIGTGVQARAHAEALVEFFGLSRFWIASRDVSHAHAFCDALAAAHRQVTAMPIGLPELSSCCQQADLVIAMTTAKAPVIPEDIPPHTLAIGVGAFKPDMRELPVGLLRTRSVIVDHLAGAQHEAGDLLAAGLDWSTVRDLPDVVTNGFVQTGVAPIFKTVGHAAWDLAAARVAIQP